MAVIQDTISVNGSFTNLSISGSATKTGSMTWTIPDLPNNAVIVSTSLSATLNVTMYIGSSNVTINDSTFRGSSQLSFNLGTTLINSLSVSAKGNSWYAYGNIRISNIVYSITYEYAVSDPPIITIISQSKDKISRIENYDRCEVSFECDKELSYWEARATLPGTTPSHGVGLLVESGSLALGNIGYVYVDDEELTNGDGDYTINIYGQDTDGMWSDG